jgi:hypothetical protein
MKKLRQNSGLTLTELMVAVGIGVLALTAAFSAAITVQRCWAASEEFAADKREQSRLNDYLALDLRRALSITGASGNVLLTVTIPKYFDDSGKVVTPTLVKTPEKVVLPKYGTAPLTVVYRKYGSTITRTVGNGTPMVIAEGVADFECAIERLGTGDSVATRVSFQPGLQRSGTASTAAKTATTVYNTIRLRNPVPL